ncbi:MAG: UvrD-helicase domain-containing protein, partial [Candidatus Omnitrophica bacterium]|nr:UvrD-helicase domain-containing protein [Candidatus Omnitrophota bacterium]
MDKHTPPPSGVFVVEASAGSGKTYALARQYIRLLLHAPSSGDAESVLASMLAITFTNKAAREMKERIIELLKIIALGCFRSPAEQRAFTVEAGVSEPSARSKAGMYLDVILKRYTVFQVQTMDSFISMLVAACAYELGLTGNARIVSDELPYIARVLDETISAAAAQPAVKTRFEAFLRQYLYLENKTVWFVKKDILSAQAALFRQRHMFGKRFAGFSVPTERTTVLKKSFLTLVARFLNQPRNGVQKVFCNGLEDFLAKHPDYFNLDDLASKAFDKEAVPMNKGTVCPPPLAALWAQIRQTLVQIAELEALSLFNTYLDIFFMLEQRLGEHLRQEDVQLLSQLNQIAHDVLRRAAAGDVLPELYYRFAVRYRHFLIDEFQDTSRLQWENFFPFIEDALAAGGSFFYVGDRKQAIYRFRGGEVRLFDTIQPRLAAFGIFGDHLEVNYRSAPEIVGFVTAAFSADHLRQFLRHLQPEEVSSPRCLTEDQQREICGVFAQSRQIPRDGSPAGSVVVEPLLFSDPDDKEIVVRDAVVQCIRRLLVRYCPADIAVLCRTNDQVETATAWLSVQGWPVESERTANIRNHPLVREMLELIRFLADPADDAAFANFLLGDIFFQAVQLPAAAREDFFLALRQQRGSKAAGQYLYKKFQDRFPR